MNRKKLLITLMLTVLLALPLTAGLRREDIAVHMLVNGMKVLLLEDHDIPNIAYYTFFRVGSRNERPGLTGVSHFIEHMMFNGTRRFGPGQFDRVMEFNGGANNAYTSEDMTVYTDWFPKAALEKMIHLEADRIQRLVFDPKVLESERGVIASERRLGVENDYESLLDETVQAAAVMAHPYHWGVIGWMSDILSWQRDQIIAYYRLFYSPNNAVLVVVGDFEAPRLMGLIRKYYSSIPRGPESPLVKTVEPPQLGPRRVEIRKPAQTPSFIVAFHSPAAGDPEFPAIDLLENILLRGESSRLYRRLVSETQLAVSVGGGVYESIDPFLFVIRVKPKADADLKRIEQIIDEELARIAGQGVSDRELQKAKNAIRTSFYAPLQTIAGKANLLGHSELLYGGFERLFTMMDRYAPLTGQQLQAACAKYLTPVTKTVGVLIPQGGGQ